MKKAGRNDLCPCGSGRKYKHCCQSRERAPTASGRPAEEVIARALQTAVQHHQAGELPQAEAIYRQVLQWAPNHPDALNLLGVIAHQSGRHELAADLVGKAVAVWPSNPMYHCNLGLVLHAQLKLDAAVEHYRKALECKPDSPEIHSNLGNVFRDQGRLDEAVEHYRKAIQNNPGDAEVYVNLGNVLAMQGGLAAAAENYHKALSSGPSSRKAHLGLARLHMDLGRFDEAEAALTQVLTAYPEDPVAWAALAGLRKMTLEDEGWLATALKLVSRSEPVLPVQEAIGLRFALGKFYDDTEQYDLAFEAYREANTLKRKVEGGLNRAGATRMVDALIANHNQEFVNRVRKGASLSQRPVFVVGMPRSGTSLTEQIIASHPQAFGAGELSFWWRQMKAREAVILEGRLDSSLVVQLAHGYEERLRELSPEAVRVVDKMPNNFLRLGLMHAVFPRARILHIRRNPVDTCLSIYFQNFKATHGYGTDLGDLAFYYREYARLMHHWRATLPVECFLEISYEALTEDPERWSRQIIEFLDLPWDARCLEPHKTERKVGTASKWQVRQKIYQSSRERWRRYEKHVGPLLELMDAKTTTEKAR